MQKKDETYEITFSNRKKDYSNDVAIAKSWKQLKNILSCAHMMTIFRYGASKSDTEAVSMLKEA